LLLFTFLVLLKGKAAAAWYVLAAFSLYRAVLKLVAFLFFLE